MANYLQRVAMSGARTAPAATPAPATPPILPEIALSGFSPEVRSTGAVPDDNARAERPTPPSPDPEMAGPALSMSPPASAPAIPSPKGGEQETVPAPSTVRPVERPPVRNKLPGIPDPIRVPKALRPPVPPALEFKTPRVVSAGPSRLPVPAPSPAPHSAKTPGELPPPPPQSESLTAPRPPEPLPLRPFATSEQTTSVIRSERPPAHRRPPVLAQPHNRQAPPLLTSAIADQPRPVPRAPRAAPDTIPTTAAALPRKETRITIGRVEVQVNNRLLQPPMPSPRPAPAETRLNLESRYLNRFSLRL